MDVLLLIRRYLVTRRIAFIACVCVALAVCAMVVVTSVMDGFRARIWGQMRSLEPDLTIAAAEKRPREHFRMVQEELAAEMTSVGGPLEVLAPRLEALAELVTKSPGRGTLRRPVQLLGVDWELEAQVIPIERLIEDKLVAPLRDPSIPKGQNPLRYHSVPGIVIGNDIARALDLRGRKSEGNFFLTDHAKVFTARIIPDKTTESGWGYEYANVEAGVVAGFASRHPEADGRLVLIDRKQVDELIYPRSERGPDCTWVHAKVAESHRSNLESTLKRLQRDHPRLEFKSWVERNQELLNALDVEKRSMTIVLGFIVLIAVSLIMGLLYMMVLEKTRDIGVLRSMGFSQAKVIILFLLYGTVLGVVGMIIGTVAGCLLVQNLNSVTAWLGEYGVELFRSDIGYSFKEIPAILDPAQVALIALVTVLFSMFAGGIAAWRAAVVDPVKCLRYE